MRPYMDLISNEFVFAKVPVKRHDGQLMTRVLVDRKAMQSGAYQSAVGNPSAVCIPAGAARFHGRVCSGMTGKNGPGAEAGEEIPKRPEWLGDESDIVAILGAFLDKVGSKAARRS